MIQIDTLPGECALSLPLQLVDLLTISCGCALYNSLTSGPA